MSKLEEMCRKLDLIVREYGYSLITKLELYTNNASQTNKVLYKRNFKALEK